MVAICVNRPDGDRLGYYLSYMTTCMIDTLVVPIPAVVLILAFFLLWATRGRRPVGGGDDDRYGDHVGLVRLGSNKNGETPTSTRGAINLNSAPKKQGKVMVALVGGCSFILVAIFAMHVLEISRLAAGLLGIGLICICLPPLLIVLISLYLPLHATNSIANRARPHSKRWIVTVGVWTIGMMIVEGIKLANLIQYQVVFTDRWDKSDSQHKYPGADRNLDTGVILGLYCVFLVVYGILSFKDMRRK